SVAEGAKAPLQLEDGTDRRAPNRTDPAVPLELPLRLARPRAVGKSPSATGVVNGFFRGKAADARAEVRIGVGADLVLVQRPPTGGAAVALRADDDLDLGSLVIVFDCSGSMRASVFNTRIVDRPEESRFRKAQLAIQSLRIPKNTFVSMYTFAQK